MLVWQTRNQITKNENKIRNKKNKKTNDEDDRVWEGEEKKEVYAKILSRINRRAQLVQLNK